MSEKVLHGKDGRLYIKVHMSRSSCEGCVFTDFHEGDCVITRRNLFGSSINSSCGNKCIFKEVTNGI